MPTATRIVIKRKRNRPNLGKFKSVSYDRINRVFEGAIKAFVRGVATEVGKHIDTGMSMGSLIPLARTVNAMEYAAFGTKGPKKGLTSMDGTYHKDVYKNVTQGIRAGTDAFKLLRGSPARPVFRFEFQIRVFQYLLHEYGYQTPAWNSTIKGRFAFEQYLITHKREIPPEFREYMETTTSTMVY